jgi:hypothetical protein
MESEVPDNLALAEVNRPADVPIERDVAWSTAPGRVGPRSVSTDAQCDHLRRWFPGPAGSPGPLAWPVLLIPEAVDGGLRAPAEWSHVYHRLRWWAPVPRRFEVTASVAWVSILAGSVEAAITTVATAGGHALAQSTTVLRGPGNASPRGERALPRRPPLSAGRRRSLLIIPERDVQAFAAMAGMTYDVFQDARKAWALGYPNILVPSVLLFAIQMHTARVGDDGRVEMWFRRPVPSGSVLEFWDHQPGVWSANLVGGRVAAVARLTRPSDHGSG